MFKNFSRFFKMRAFGWKPRFCPNYLNFDIHTYINICKNISKVESDLKQLISLRQPNIFSMCTHILIAF